MSGSVERRVRFVEQITGDDVVVMTFSDPALRYAVLAEGDGDVRGEGLDVVLLPAAAALPANTVEPAAVFVRYRGVELTWSPGRAMLQCDSEQAEPLLKGVVEFAYYERELRLIEDEIASSWVELEQDKALAFQATPADLKRGDVVGGRMDRVLQRRIRLARMESRLYAPDAKLPAAAQKLGEELREKAGVEARMETVDGQLEVFEHIYEMSGQRLGEYRASSQEHTLEWVIIVLLGAEALLMLVQVLWRVKG